MKKLLFIILVTAWFTSAPAADQKSSFKFESWEGPEIQIFVSTPSESVAELPVVFVMHGMQRNADEYRDQWHALATEHQFLLVVPEFDRENFPGSRGYNLGNVFDQNDMELPSAQWSFSAIEPVFDEVRRRFGSQEETYSIYGHSAGSQFVHRFLMHIPEARVHRAVIANAGWYTLPDFSIDWPYGLKGSLVTQNGLDQLLRHRVTVLLGTHDNDPNGDGLRRTPEALSQGNHRLERGFYYFAKARFAGAQQNKHFIPWKLAQVNGVDHNNAQMAPAAIPFLIGD
jgi:hypothetical protein